ncbi:hypothetical protein M758_6G088500 [Ceratodon purpureus]|nr:hypothetical protein M758_6G088500 [Ceratodon purpureus]
MHSDWLRSRFTYLGMAFLSVHAMLDFSASTPYGTVSVTQKWNRIHAMGMIVTCSSF